MIYTVKTHFVKPGDDEFVTERIEADRVKGLEGAYYFYESESIKAIIPFHGVISIIVND